MKSEEKKSRLEWIDAFKGLCMFLVILSHSKPTANWYLFYNPIFITGFFFISGFFFYNPNRVVSSGQKFLNILTTLLIPCLLYKFLSFGVNNIIKGDFFFLDGYLKTVLRGESLWFTNVLIVSEIISLIYMWSWRGKLETLRIILFPLLTLLFFFFLPQSNYPWNFRTAFFACFYFGLGMIANYYGSLTKILISKNMGGVFLIMLVVLTFMDKYFIHQKGVFHVEFENYFFFIVESIVAIYAYLWLFSRIKPAFTPLVFIGKNSLLFYFLNHPVLIFINKLSTIIGLNENHWWYSLLCAIIVCVLIWPIILFVNKYIPVLAGKYKIVLKSS